MENYSVKFEVDYPERSSRLLALFGIPFFIFKQLILIPHLILLYFLNIAAIIAIWFSYWAILFKGKYPQSFFNFIVGVLRWQNRVVGWLYSLTDTYPPFSLR